MIITKDFVVLNYPKTCSAYLRAYIKSLYKQYKRLNKILYSSKMYKDLHFPKIYRNIGSNYNCGWWKENHLYNLDAIMEKYAYYPELNLFKRIVNF